MGMFTRWAYSRDGPFPRRAYSRDWHGPEDCLLQFEGVLLTGTFIMAERSRTRRNTLERRALPKLLKRQFARASKTVFKMLEKVKRK